MQRVVWIPLVILAIACGSFLHFRTSVAGHKALRAEPARSGALPALTGSSAPPPASSDTLTPEERSRITAGLKQCRDLLHAIERSNTEPILKNEKEMHVVPLHPPNEQQLDSVYGALTKVADTFPGGSPAATEFSVKAAALIHEYRTYENPGRLLFHYKATETEAEKITLVEFTDEDADVRVTEDGALNIKSGQTRLDGRNVIERYRHLFEGQ